MNRETKLPYKRVVVKFGTSLLTGGSQELSHEMMSGLVAQVARLHQQGLEMTIVSSGAIAAGRFKLGQTKDIRGVPSRQVLASIGQNRLMYLYEQMFSQHDITVAQALLTKTGLADRTRYLNTRNTLLALMELGVICVINENDVVAVDEIREDKFGDNDNLSAMVSNLVDADLLLILTDIEGLYTADPRNQPDARFIPQVEKIDNNIVHSAAGTQGNLGTGGMATKIEAARLATTSGVTVILADGRKTDTMLRAVAGESVGTRFLPTTTRRESRQRWMLSGLSTRGKLVVDAGAAHALKEQKGSLLAAGIREVSGDFKRGDIVDIHDADGTHISCGIANYNSEDINVIKGAHSSDIAGLLGHDFGSDVVNRNNLVML